MRHIDSRKNVCKLLHKKVVPLSSGLVEQIPAAESPKSRRLARTRGKLLCWQGERVGAELRGRGWVGFQLGTPRHTGTLRMLAQDESGLPGTMSDACARGVDASSIAITAGARRDRDTAPEELHGASIVEIYRLIEKVTGSTSRKASEG